jgi:hypothetical protein
MTAALVASCFPKPHVQIVAAMIVLMVSCLFSGRLSADEGGPRVWFVTETSSGFGLEIVRAALARGDLVAATAPDPAAEGLPGPGEAPAGCFALGST